MTTRMQDNRTWFVARAKENAGRTITYYRGATTGTLTAWVNDDKEELINNMGFPVNSRIRSYKCLLGDLPVTDPRAGDLIDEVIGSSTYTFEVRPPDDNTDAVEWVDGDGTILRVNTGAYSIA